MRCSVTTDVCTYVHTWLEVDDGGCCPTTSRLARAAGQFIGHFLIRMLPKMARKLALLLQSQAVALARGAGWAWGVEESGRMQTLMMVESEAVNGIVRRSFSAARHASRA